MTGHKTAAPQDSRAYVRVAVDLPLNPKLAELDDPAAGWAYVVSLCYCGQSLTDGHFPVSVVIRLAGVDRGKAETLVAQGLWHEPGHDCDRCEQPKQAYAVVHDYLQHQRSADEARDLTSKRREAGRRGAERRWGSKPIANAMASAMAPAMANAWQTDGREEERREELLSRPAEPERDDVNRLCSHLRDRIAANGVKTTTITKTWKTDARLLLDRDGRDLDEALRLIDWCQQDSFWRSNVLSMPKFRKQYDQLRLKATEDPNWRHLRAVESIPDNDINPDEILGRDYWTPPRPPRDIDDGPREQLDAWMAERIAEHRAERIAEARRTLARRQNRSTA